MVTNTADQNNVNNVNSHQMWSSMNIYQAIFGGSTDHQVLINYHKLNICVQTFISELWTKYDSKQYNSAALTNLNEHVQWESNATHVVDKHEGLDRQWRPIPHESWTDAQKQQVGCSQAPYWNRRSAKQEPVLCTQIYSNNMSWMSDNCHLFDGII